MQQGKYVVVLRLVLTEQNIRVEEKVVVASRRRSERIICPIG